MIQPNHSVNSESNTNLLQDFKHESTAMQTCPCGFNANKRTQVVLDHQIRGTSALNNTALSSEATRISSQEMLNTPVFPAPLQRASLLLFYSLSLHLSSCVPHYVCLCHTVTNKGAKKSCLQLSHRTGVLKLYILRSSF